MTPCNLQIGCFQRRCKEQLHRKHFTRKRPFILDVRQPEEWNEAHIPESTLIPLDQLPNRINELPKDQGIVIVCRSGNRSAQGRDILLESGFTNVTSMAGGLNQWKTAGYPTVSGS
ncbi:MAG TPA: rhodanese-like domain-containing protein [Anaerolineales bacterium]|nr:rhodanese-like domain-containing protein [Anaerolineales bacterium]